MLVNGQGRTDVQGLVSVCVLGRGLIWFGEVSEDRAQRVYSLEKLGRCGPGLGQNRWELQGEGVAKVPRSCLGPVCSEILFLFPTMRFGELLCVYVQLTL